MAGYRFKAIRPDGSLTEGVAQAASEEELVKRLQGQGLMPLLARPEGSRLRWLSAGRHSTGNPRLTLRLARELATLLGAGMALDHALQLIADLEKNEEAAELVRTLKQRVRRGHSLSRAMAGQQNVFTPLQISMVKAGEASGALAQALERLAEQLERSEALKEEIRSALIYPTLLLTVATLSVVGLLLFVVPHFAEAFTEMGQPLPAATSIVVTTAELLRHWGWLLLILFPLLSIGLRQQLNDPAARIKWDHRLLRWPAVGILISKVEAARFSHTLAILLESGVALPKALDLATGAVGNMAMKTALQQAADALKEGHSLGDLLSVAPHLPPLLVEMVRVGEESGELPSLLHKAGDDFERQTRTAVARLLTLLEPALIIGLGAMVGGIIVSILVAVLDANQLLL